MVKMKELKKARQGKGVSQRRLAALAHLSYKTLQLLETGGHDPRLSTLGRLAAALGYPPALMEDTIETLFSIPPDAVAVISEQIACKRGENSWKTWLFNFVDAFRSAPDPQKAQVLIQEPPTGKTPPGIKALLASTVETLCLERGLAAPPWTEGIPPLDGPWFVSEVENLKPMALVESPVYFRRRNIFVLENFLERR